MALHYLNTTLTPSVQEAQEQYYGRRLEVDASEAPDELGAMEQVFIENRDSFYLASVTEDGWPYVQHRGGPKGFLHVLDEHTLAFADLSGNRQLLSTGNIRREQRVSLFLMDYPRRQRLKILAQANVVAAKDAGDLVSSLAPEGIPPRLVERIFRFHVVGYDWNCPKYITPRYTAEEIATMTQPLKSRLSVLEAALAAAGIPIPPEPPN